ncbi:Cellobiose dehydrogenase, partial [Lachnellula suecica]
MLLWAFAAGVYAQSTAYTDANTGITFQQFETTAGVSWGMAVPDTVGTDFIGQMVYPINSSGYAGISLGSLMVRSVLVAAWPNEGSVVASFRETSGYTNPAVYTAAGLSMTPISNGTFVNSTHLSYTFLCSGCIGLNTSFDATATEITLGWALGTDAVTTPASASAAGFTYHDGGFGNFGLTLSSATSADYSTWAAIASNKTSGGSDAGSGSDSTCTSSATNVTTAVSNSTYDYIVAGAGPAESSSRSSGKSVILIERGQESTYASGGRSTVSWNDTVTQYDVPSMSYYLTTASDTSEYCTDVASMAGCILGGDTMVNALMFVRPQEADFNDEWPAGWQFADVSAAADRLYERNPGTTLPSEDGQHYDQAAWNVLSSFFNSVGYKQVDAIQSPNEKTKVFSYPPWDIRDGKRGGPVSSYYPLAAAMSNFKLSLNTKVIRAVRSGSTVSGVEVEDSMGARHIINVNARGKVILASGAMSSPRILFNSGIGPTDQIITVKNGCTGVTLPVESDWINLPVGQNL